MALPSNSRSLRRTAACLTGAAAVAAVVGVSSRVAVQAESPKPFPKVEILYNTLESHKQIAEALQQMWQKDLGVTVSLANTEWKVYLEKMKNLDYDLARGGWVWDYNDPHNMFECWTTGNGNNRTGWSNKKYDDLMAGAMLERVNEKRWAIYQQAEQLINDEAPILPIYFYVNKNMLAPRVKGWFPNVLNLHPYDAMWLEENGQKLPPEKQRLVFNNAAEPATLDPAIMTGSPEHKIALALFEGLTRLDPATLAPLPGVAEKWEISEDGKTYTFHLRHDALWSNGDPITAEDFVYSWKRVIDPTALPTPSEYAQIFFWVEGARAVIGTVPDGEDDKKPEPKDPKAEAARIAADMAKVGIEAKDAHTLVVKLVAPCPFWLSLCAFETLMPVHKATVEKHAIKWTRAENMVSNGPYVLKDWTPQKELLAVANPNYWGKDRVQLREVVFLPIDNLDTSLNKFIAGEVDWIDDVPIARADEVKKHPSYTKSPYLTIYFYRFNTKKAPFNDARVRKAFSLAVNRRDICSKVQRFGEIPSDSVIVRGCGVPEYRPPAGLFKYDPPAARKLLREAGYEVPGN